MTTPSQDSPQPGTAPGSVSRAKPLGWIIIAVIGVIIAAGIFADGKVKVERNWAPAALSDGSYDATVWGPSKPVKEREDIVNLARRMDTDPFGLGDVNAPVTVVEFSDFECPFCANFANTVEPSVIADYVNSGKVRIEWNDFPVNGDNAMAAARAGRAAAEQGYFHEFKHALYKASEDVQGHPNNTIDNFVTFAEEAKIPDLEKFKADAESDKYDDYINNSRMFAVGLGMQGTPTILVGNQPVPGNISPEEMAKTIDKQLELIDKGELTPTKPGTTDGNDYPDLLESAAAPAAQSGSVHDMPEGTAVKQK